MGCMADPCVCMPPGPGGLNCLVARRPPPTLIDRVSNSRASSGATVTVDTGGTPNRRGKLHAHVVAMHVVGAASITSTTALANAGFGPSGLMQGILHQFRLIDHVGHVYGQNLDGRDLLTDLATRAPDQDLISRLHENIPDEANTVTRRMQWSWYFGTPLPGRRISVAGAIPLAALQARPDAAQFRVNNAIPSAPSGLTFNNFGSSGTVLWVYFEIAWLDGVIYDQWTLDNYTIDELSANLHYCGRHTEYAWLAPRVEDTGGASLGSHAGFTFRAGDQELASALTATEARDQAQLYAGGIDSSQSYVTNDSGVPTDIQSRGPVAVINGIPQSTLAVDAADTARIEQGMSAYPILLPGNGHRDAPTCQLNYNLSSMGSHTTNRFLHRVRRTPSDADMTSVMKAMCAKPGTPIVIGDTGIEGPDSVGPKSVVMLAEGQ